ncbi:DMT family transporter [Methanobacterium sp.]|uniref:DMT family transporter n=1 Tax=Methanobacterium sp. TaxID=2164 RepID=UPI003C754D20
MEINPWIYLVLAGIMEMGWAIGLKFTEGFTQVIPSVITAGFMILSLYLLSLALKSISIGTGYAIWTGIGAIGTAIIGMLLLGDSKEMGRVACIFIIITGILGLKFFSNN